MQHFRFFLASARLICPLAYARGLQSQPPVAPRVRDREKIAGSQSWQAKAPAPRFFLSPVSKGTARFQISRLQCRCPQLGLRTQFSRCRGTEWRQRRAIFCVSQGIELQETRLESGRVTRSQYLRVETRSNFSATRVCNCFVIYLCSENRIAPTEQTRSPSSVRK